MKVDKLGRVLVTEQEAFDALYSGRIQTFEDVFVDGDVQKYNHAKQRNADFIPDLKSTLELVDIDRDQFDQMNQQQWFMPEEYKSFPIHEWLLNQCKTERERDRVNTELELFIQFKMYDLLFYLKYLVDTMQANKIVWGVGRGSSVSSYILFLIGIHKIDSLKYDLDISEFLKEKQNAI